MNIKILGYLGGRGSMCPIARFLAGMTILVVALPAIGSTNKAEWITEASDYILNYMPQVEGFMWFNNYKPNENEPDWRIVPDSPNLPDQAVIDAYNAAWHNGRTLQRGVFIDGAPPDMTKIDYFESYVGAHDRIGWYQSLGEDFPTASVNAVLNRGATPYIVWQPYDSSFPHEDATSGTSRLQNILDGDYDYRIQQWAQEVKTVNGQVEISFGHEMNGDWFSWGYLNSHNGNTPELYAEAFRYVVDMFNQWGATNVDWVWCVNASWQDDFSAAFPGIDYVDILGMDGFNWNMDVDLQNDWDYEHWREFSEIFDAWGGYSTYQRLVELGLDADLPIIIGEFGTNTPEPATLAFLAVGALALVRRRR